MRCQPAAARLVPQRARHAAGGARQQAVCQRRQARMPPRPVVLLAYSRARLASWQLGRERQVSWPTPTHTRQQRQTLARPAKPLQWAARRGARPASAAAVSRRWASRQPCRLPTSSSPVLGARHSKYARILVVCVTTCVAKQWQHQVLKLCHVTCVGAWLPLLQQRTPQLVEH